MSTSSPKMVSFIIGAVFIILVISFSYYVYFSFANEELLRRELSLLNRKIEEKQKEWLMAVSKQDGYQNEISALKKI